MMTTFRTRDSAHEADRPALNLHRWMPLIIGVVYTVVYARAAAPGIVELFDDTLEFQLVLPTLGIAHPTGYPLYTLLGALWSRLLFPFGEWAWRVNLLSALFGGVTVGLLCAAAYKLIRATSGDEWAGGGALLAALLFALGSVWWEVTTVAEVYALHALFVALILWLALRAAELEADRRPRALLLLFAAVGLALAHHRTTLLLLPALAVYLWWSQPLLRRPSRLWLLSGAAMFLPLLLYLLIPVRAAMGVSDLNGSYVPTWQGFWEHVLARRYTAFFGATELAIERDWSDWLTLAVGQVGWVVLIAGPLGLIVGLAQRQGRRGWLLIALALAANGAFAWLYRVGDVEVFLLPVWLLLALAAGNGIAQLERLEARSMGLAYVPLLLILLLIFQRLDGRAPVHSRAQEWRTHDYAVALAQADFPPGSRVLGLEGEVTALRYMQRAHGAAAGVTPLTANDEDARRSLLESALHEGAPVYLTRELPGIETLYSFGGDSALVRVFPRGQAGYALPPEAIRLDTPMAEGALTLVGYTLDTTPGTEGRQSRLALYWLPTTVLSQTFKVSLRPLAVDGTSFTRSDGAPLQDDLFPLRMVAPTTTWLPDDLVRDVYLLPVQADAPFAHIELVLYDADTLLEAGRVQIPAAP